MRPNGTYSILAILGILIFVDGKKSIREVRYVDMDRRNTGDRTTL